MVRYCSVYGCLENTNKTKNRRFFKFPSDQQRCKIWITKISRDDLEKKSNNTLYTSYFVCELHFASDHSDLTKKGLKKDAVPTLLLPQAENSSGNKIQNTSTQTDNNLSYFCACKSQLNSTPSTSAEIPSTSQVSHSAQTTKILTADSPRKRKLRLELKSETKKRKLLESVTENAEKPDMSPLLKKNIKTQKILKKKYQGNRYDQEYVMFAINIYFASPAAYRIFSEILRLPSIRTLQRRMAFDISTKFNENVIKSLKSKSVRMSKTEKYCIICADEISLKRHLHYQINKDKVVGFHEINEKQNKEIATQAFVVMARGIFSNWKQPLAFCFLGQSKNYAELNTWLENLISTMINIGFNVCAFTSDQGSNFVSMAKNKCVSPDQPFFFVNGKKIYYIFDVPHVTKSLRNNLINYDFSYSDDVGTQQVASWNDVESMYEIEKNKKYKMAFKLTESHIRPNNFEKMRVKYATQVLSRTVAVSINTLVEEGKLNEKCLGTAKLIELMNDTFDILNSSTVSDDYKYKKAFYHAKYQTNTLEKAHRVLSKLRVINRNTGKDVTNTMKFITGFLTSIKAISCLASDLKTAGYRYLFTRRLNQDALENFFGKVRLQGGNCREPTAIQFIAAFKKLFLVNIIRHSEYGNCAEDIDQLLMSVQETQISLRSEENVSIEPLKRSLVVGTNDYRFELPEENAFTYVCGYLLKKCFDQHKNCEVMKNYIKSDQQLNESNLFIHLKAYNTNKPFGALINPPANFKQDIKQMDKTCEDHLKNSNFYRVGNEIMSKINEIEFNLPCSCFPLEYLKKLFVRFRIFNVIRHNNKNFRDKSFKRKYFSECNL